MRNGSSSIIGIGPGQSLQHGDYCSTNKYGGSLNRPQNNINQAPKVISSFNEPSTNTLPLNRISNAHQKNIHHIGAHIDDLRLPTFNLNIPYFLMLKN